eukprot:COSAG05_NODE_10848_length_542_cov_1.467269_1_plen_38_part_10
MTPEMLEHNLYYQIILILPVVIESQAYWNLSTVCCNLS